MKLILSTILILQVYSFGYGKATSLDEFNLALKKLYHGELRASERSLLAEKLWQVSAKMLDQGLISKPECRELVENLRAHKFKIRLMPSEAIKLNYLEANALPEVKASCKDLHQLFVRSSLIYKASNVSRRKMLREIEGLKTSLNITL